MFLNFFIKQREARGNGFERNVYQRKKKDKRMLVNSLFQSHGAITKKVQSLTREELERGEKGNKGLSENGTYFVLKGVIKLNKWVGKE